jgi:hypothetical protein
MTNERDVKGVITWKSIGSRLALSGPAVYARDVKRAIKEFNIEPRWQARLMAYQVLR